MPGRSGFGILKAIKDCHPDIEVIVITGYKTLENAKEAIRLGAEDFIPKPFNVDDIVAMVAKTMEKRRNNLKINPLTE
jgi:DNA-binding NtrC family response regulator